MQKKWHVSCNYGPNRLSTSNLIDSYEKLFPKKKYKISSSKKIETDTDFQFLLKQPRGNSK